MNNADVGPVGNLLAYAIAVYATFETLLLAELAASNVIAGTPMAACGRVAFGMACALARSEGFLLRASSAVPERRAIQLPIDSEKQRLAKPWYRRFCT